MLSWLASAGSRLAVWWSGTGEIRGPTEVVLKRSGKPEPRLPRLLGREFPRLCEQGVQYIRRGAKEPFWPEPSIIYALSVPTWTKVNGKTVEIVSVWAYSLLRPFHGRPYQRVLEFIVDPAREWASTIIDHRLVFSQRKEPVGEGVEVRVGCLITGLWTRLVLQGITASHLLPAMRSFSVTEALWSNYFDFLPSDDLSSIRIVYFHDDEAKDQRVVKGFKFRESDKRTNSNEATAYMKLEWSSEKRIPNARALRQSHWRWDRVVDESKGLFGVEWGTGEVRSETAVGVVMDEGGRMSAVSFVEAKFPGWTAFPEDTRCAIKVASLDGQRTFRLAIGVDEAGRVWEAGRSSPAKLKTSALRAFVGAMPHLRSADVDRFGLQPEIARCLREHMSWNPDARHPNPPAF